MIRTAESVSPKHPDKYKRKLVYNKLWKRKNIPRKTSARWGVITYDQKRGWRKYAQSPKGIYQCLKRGIRCIKNNRLSLTQEEFIKWYTEIEKSCFYCEITELQWQQSSDCLSKRYRRLTIDRKDNNGKYELGNLVLSCFRCNTIKSDIFTENEMLIIGQILKSKRSLIYD